ncbi:dentin sialophosphoprotein isoform X2 [Parasteatoda tepidariorum]|uniref:dentin sialophosphoprotein isoform X2 n=1 Tax=Parasteatoda tepidariorum TaxID=114398 RepID=UPI0039BCF483
MNPFFNCGLGFFIETFIKIYYLTDFLNHRWRCIAIGAGNESASEEGEDRYTSSSSSGTDNGERADNFDDERESRSINYHPFMEESNPTEDSNMPDLISSSSDESSGSDEEIRTGNITHELFVNEQNQTDGSDDCEPAMISDRVSDLEEEIESENETNQAVVDSQNQSDGFSDSDPTVISTEPNDVIDEIKQDEATLEEPKEMTGTIDIGATIKRNDGCPHTYVIDLREKRLLAESSKVKKRLAQKKKGFRSFMRQLFTSCYKRV